MRGVLFRNGPDRSIWREIEIDLRLGPETDATPGVYHNFRPHGKSLIEFCHRKISDMGTKDILMVDIGAHVGSFALLAAFHPNLWVIAFEPLPDMFDILQSNIRLNGLADRVQAFPYAIFDKPGKAVLKVPRKKVDLGGATLGSRPSIPGCWELEVECRRLDDWDWGRPIDLMKIDVEGAELMVLRSGEKTIREQKPALLLEYVRRGTLQFGYKPRAIRRLLESWGYSRFERPRVDLWATA